jgi:glycosyltransferase involved in cell wall biosynthesis
VYQGIRAGCAIVTSDTVPQRRTLGDLAVYVPPADPQALADTLRDLSARPERVAELQAASRAASDRFGPAGVVGDLVAELSYSFTTAAHDGGRFRLTSTPSKTDGS